MNWLRRKLRELWRRLLHRNRHMVVRIPHPQNRQQPFDHDQRPPFAPGFNPVAEALRQIFAVRHRAEERWAFHPVGPDGRVQGKVEQWFRESDAMVAQTDYHKVCTCSGQIVSPDQIRGRCWCGGYDDEIGRCQANGCGLPLCRRHQYTFANDTATIMLCGRHYREAVDALNTWKSLDLLQPTRRPQ